MPRVTIAVPCYNEEEFLEETVRSLMAQSERDLEILICDNASTDATAAIAARLADEDPRVKWSPLAENIGGRLNFLRSFKEGSAPFFMWAGAHDLYAPMFVERLLKRLEQEENAVMAFCDSVFIQRDGRQDPGEPVFRMPDLSQDDVVERFRRIVWSLSRCDLLHGLMRRERVDVAPLERVKELPDMAFLPALTLAGAVVLERELLFFRRLNRGVQNKEENEAHLAADGYVDSSGNGRDDRWTSVRDSLLQSISEAHLSSSERRTLEEVTCFCFLKRFSVPWDIGRAATGREKLRRFFLGRRPRGRKQLQRDIHDRLLREHLPRDWGDASLDARLQHLLEDRSAKRRDRSAPVTDHE